MIPAQATIVQAGVPGAAAAQPQSDPPKKKPRAAHLIPKLTVDDFSHASFQEAIKIGRKAKARGKPSEGGEAKALGDLLRNMSAWAKEIAPQYSFSEFMFASQALGTNRSLRPMLANLRLAEFREVNAEFEATPANVESEATPAVDGGGNANEGGRQVMAEAPPDELQDLGFDHPSGDGWEEEEAMMDRMDMEMEIMQTKAHMPPASNVQSNAEVAQE